jgi:hypothetical protein
MNVTALSCALLLLRGLIWMVLRKLAGVGCCAADHVSVREIEAKLGTEDPVLRGCFKCLEAK